MRCRKCWAFGHTTTRCRNTPVCSYCGLCGYIKEECTPSQDLTRIHCVNCRGQHEASSVNCPKYVENFEIIKFAHSNKPFLPFKEAQKKWLSLNPRNVRSANTSTNLATVDISSQLPANGQENQKKLSLIPNNWNHLYLHNCLQITSLKISQIRFMELIQRLPRFLQMRWAEPPLKQLPS
jgi:hypothetical protein